MTNTLQKLIEKYPDKDWDWDELSRNPNITLEFIEKHPKKPWNWFKLQHNSNFKIIFPRLTFIQICFLSSSF